ncbi:MAG: hypothetical protein FJ319_13440 [SAR202 cluster bacterium]|nr:hypothetical protein [SAR202 cluster bacterium]
MALITPVLAAISRMAEKILNTAFGWATITLFGRVQQSRQIFLSIISFGSVAWLASVLGIAFPEFGTFLLSFVTLPDWVNEAWVRLAMLVAALVLPLVIGVVGLIMLEKEDRPAGIGGKLVAVLRGYPYAFGLALTLIMMVLFVPFMKLRTLIKRWDSQHVPVVVEPNDYLEVVDGVQESLEARGWPITRRRAGLMIRLPTKILDFFAGGAIDDLVVDNLSILKTSTGEVILHPADLVISGKKWEVNRARAAITEHLAFSKAHLTWSTDANKFEDRIVVIWRAMKGAYGPPYWDEVAHMMKEIDRDLKELNVPFDEWETLFRAKLTIERELLWLISGDAALALVALPEATDLRDARERQETKTARMGVVGAVAGASAGVVAGVIAAQRARANRKLEVTLEANPDSGHKSVLVHGVSVTDVKAKAWDRSEEMRRKAVARRREKG